MKQFLSLEVTAVAGEKLRDPCRGRGTQLCFQVRDGYSLVQQQSCLPSQAYIFNTPDRKQEGAKLVKIPAKYTVSLLKKFNSFLYKEIS